MMPLDNIGLAKPAKARRQVRQVITNTQEHRVQDAATATWKALSTREATTVISESPGVALAHADALRWMAGVPHDAVHAIVTDPPYGLIEYEDKDHAKLRAGRGGVWRIPPSFDGSQRAPLPRFTVLTPADRKRLEAFFGRFALHAMQVLVPGGHLLIASNPLVSSIVFGAIERMGLEKRGEVIRLVQTLRGGDRPKGAEHWFPDVSVMPRSAWEPWGLFRKPISEKTVADNLRRWGAGGLRRVSNAEPFRDVIKSGPTRDGERRLSPHPSLKPQRFMRQVVRAMLPICEGLVYDPFVGGGSTLAAAHRLGILSVGTELDAEYHISAIGGVPRLSAYEPAQTGTEDDAG
jgi:site-specific DNA-methyltransferase (adenine-specific)